MMEEKVRQFIAKEHLLSSDDLNIVALSGGADSVALLLVLHRLGYRLEAAHCNFKLRGTEADRDELFVKKLCKKFNIPFHTIHFETRTYAALHQVSIEMAARDLRYRYFEQLRLDIGASNICVAHHQDDATETLLMNLIRGTGIHGLTGIRPRNGHVVRPLLCVSRSDILSFLETAQQDYITDSSNLVADVVRNKLRLEVIPLLRTINPAASSNIAKTAQRMAEVERIYDNVVKAEAGRLLKDDTISIADLLNSQAPESLLFEMLTPCDFTSAQVEQLFACLNTQTGRMFLSDTHQAAIDRGRIIIEKRQATLPTMRIPEPGTYRLTDNIKFGFRLTDDAQISKVPQQATLDADNTPFPLTIRPLQTGDRFQPFGMKGSRLLSDFLTDRKLSVLQKQRQLVITDAEGRIVWVVGQRVDQRFAVNNQTCRTLTITLLPSE